MNRPLIALSLLLSTQAHASAFDSIKDQDMQASAYSLLVKNADQISLRGDIREGEKLAPIVASVEEYYRQIEEVLMNGGNLETDLKSNIDHVDTRCERNETKKAAQCDLTIQFKPLGETTVRFNVGLDSDDKAVDISSTAEVFRGD
ncbi:metalloproteinase domain-containing protein [Bdellovibrio svalbardensis]|uniref:Metalloproteinase domain-containing protein n=1 Tax=Bdellovibrio svalbardensis TaxID=2972972 RepID=A0ABT6DGI3_9BACT|nr:metalloproteinase domain-containing protein [Bdellovibrio svalbardensis]MDG0815955.1 metalloproteinase domain-containing protein [Bdellovibrio svalbardensis]